MSRLLLKVTPIFTSKRTRESRERYKRRVGEAKETIRLLFSLCDHLVSFIVCRNHNDHF